MTDIVRRLEGMADGWLCAGLPDAELPLEAAREIASLRVRLEHALSHNASEAEDAKRYRWLAAHAHSTSEHWMGRWALVIQGPAPSRDGCEVALDAAIDAAMAEMRCMCKDRSATNCPGEWEPGCDLGNNPAHVTQAQQLS